MRYVHPAEEQKRAAIAKLEVFRLDGIVQAIEENRAVPQKPPQRTEGDANGSP
jgi:hypothetical protein